MLMPANAPLRRLLVGLALLAALVLSGCDRAAELIPGNADDPRTPPATPVPESTPILVTPGLNVGSGTPVTAIPDHELARSVVQILGVDTSGGSEQIARYGSGVVVDSERRLILTSYPVVSPYRSDGSRAYTTLVVATNDEPGTAAHRSFEAEIVAADLDTGIAVLRLTRRAGGEGGNIDRFDLPAANLGSASAINTGVPLRLFSHAGGGSGTDAVSVTNATVTGQRGAASMTGRAWFKVDARLPVGASGGPAFDQAGSLVGMLAQPLYVPKGQVGQVRPVDLLTPVIDRARSTSTGFVAPLYRSTVLPADGIWVGSPAFAGNAVDSTGGRDLFDYGTRFNEGLAALYYEYDVIGATAGTVVEERWYLEGVLQDSLSSSFAWDQSGYGLVSDRIASPGPTGIPRGTWRVEIWIGGTQRTAATVTIGGGGTAAATTPSALGIGGATTVTAEGNIAVGTYAFAPQLLALFDLTGMGNVTRMQWVVFKDGQPVYTSPSIRWTGGTGGRFWAGYAGADPIQAGTWEFELHADGRIIGVATIPVF